MQPEPRCGWRIGWTAHSSHRPGYQYLGRHPTRADMAAARSLPLGWLRRGMGRRPCGDPSQIDRAVRPLASFGRLAFICEWPRRGVADLGTDRSQLVRISGGVRAMASPAAAAAQARPKGA